MTDSEVEEQAGQAGEDPVQRAIDYGIDISLLIENLRRSPTERLRRAESLIDSMVALRDEAARARARTGQRR